MSKASKDGWSHKTCWSVVAVATIVLFNSGCSAGSGDDLSVGTPTTARTAVAASPNKPSKDWLIQPGQLGPIKIGLDGGDAKLKGFAEGTPGESCGSRWEASPLLADDGISLEFRDGKTIDDLDQILISGPTPDDKTSRLSASMRTKEGVGIGTPFTKVRKIYGERLVRSEFVTDGGGMIAYTVFGPDGAIMFDAGSTYQPESKTVGRIFVLGGTSDNVQGPFLGC
jgi:hypothetical protein